MTTQPHRSTRHLFHQARGFLRRLMGSANRHQKPAHEADSYVGLFQGVIETDASPATRPPPPAAARTSGFVRLEVNSQKKATGCFLFFVDGKVLSGDIEGASEQTGFVEASFRLKPEDHHGARPVAAVGRLTLETRCARRATGPAEEMTIRFV